MKPQQLFARADDPDADVWIIHGRRYDLRPYLDRHPGGIPALEMGRGRDCTELFESYHSMSDMPARMLAQFEIPDAPVAEGPEFFDWDQTPFYDALKQRARAYFRAIGGGMRAHKAPPVAIALHALWLLLTGASLAAWALGHWYALVTLPLFYWIGPSNLLHSGAHNSLSVHPRWNRFWSYVGSAFISIFMWERQHNIAHHAHTNLEGKDPDLNHFQQPYAPTPGFRVHPRQPWLRKYRHWALSSAGQAWMTSWGPSFINEPEYLIDGYFARVVPLRFHSRLRLVRHVLGRLLILAVCIGYPIWAFDGFKAAAFAFLPLGFHGLLYFSFSQVSHVNAECFVGEDVESGKRRIEWAEHQVRTAKDYEQHSRFWGIFSIGLNLQVVHHLFPQVDPWHYPALSRIVAETCAEFDIPYKPNRRWIDSFRQMRDYLRSINEPVPANLAHQAGNLVLPKGGHLRITDGIVAGAQPGTSDGAGTEAPPGP